MSSAVTSVLQRHAAGAGFASRFILPAVPYGGIIQSSVAGPCRPRIVFSWGRVGSTGAFSDGLQAEAAAALAKNGGEQLTGEREFALAA